MREHRNQAVDQAAALLETAGHRVVSHSPVEALDPKDMPLVVVRAVDDTVVEDSAMVNGGQTVDVSLSLTAYSSVGEQEVNTTLAEVDTALAGYEYDGFEMDDPNLDGDRPVLNGTATYITRTRR